MTTRHIIEFEAMSFILVAAILSAFLVWYSNNSVQEQFHVTSPIVAANKTQVVAIPIPDAVLKVDIAEQISPNGNARVTMKTTHNANGLFTYVFTASDSDDNTTQLYTTTLEGTDSMSLPFNAWSPDNKYVFIQKNSEALIFKATGEAVTPDESYFNVAAIFAEKIQNNTYDHATGWASETLLIVNSKTPEGEKGPSYWFEVPSKAIIQLSSDF